jgi:predicted MPP superfamily phosphohydrolase
MHLVVVLTNGLLWLYTAARFVAPLPFSPAARVAVALALLLVAQYHSILHFAFGSFAAVELPRAVLIVIGWLFGTFFLLALLLVLRDLAGVLLLVVARAAGQAWLSALGVTLGLGVLALGLGTYGVWQGIRVPDIKTLAITLPRLPAAFDGYRIVQLTDLHAHGLLPASWVAAVVKKANALHPDLTVITGDLQDGPPEIRSKDVRPLADLRARDGVLAIVGNHEYYTDYARWVAIFLELGLPVLENAHVSIARQGQTVTIAGITDRQARTFAQALPDLKTALAGAPAGTPVILLSHRPDNARDSAAAGVDLQLSGHTHGGQVLGLHFVPWYFNHGFVSGLYAVGAMQLYVSNGTGLWNGFALRIGRPSEITEIVLRAGPTEAGAGPADRG